ncbi:MAG: penicillin acylase family protein [Betaproteobacteria bacterium]|nr:MAG: penicillin acylase family protein [Betaproteobacteria bacterium]
MRWVFRFAIFLLIVIALGIAGGDLFLRRSLPVTSGEIAVAGLAAPVEILRDRYGIPHIFAQSEQDAHFALGFVHAQDRLWQLEMNRRIAAGRLAEVLGPGGLETDRFLRTLGVRRAAQANLPKLDEETRKSLEAYAAGINALLATDRLLPPEFLILRFHPEPWTALDSLAWAKMKAWDLGGNWRNELLRMQLAKTLPNARIDEFLPPYPGDEPLKIRDLHELYGDLDREPPRTASAESLFPAPGGSNSWVVSGLHTASGKPLLANDPHLGLTAPSVWYLAQLHAPGLNAIGGTLPGVPGIVIGRNDRIAWGFTNTGPDVQDLYLERIDHAGNYVTPNGSQPFSIVEERIAVKGAEEERLQVRISRHGPVISDVSREALDATPRGYALALAWAALADDDLTLQAALRLERARDWKTFLDALRNLHAPQQSATYADVDGNIGFIAAGRVPVRKPANDLKGLAPAPGWDARYDWAGYLPFDELPRAFNPSGGEIVSANHKIVPPGYPHHITAEWQPPYRARRIEELLAKDPVQNEQTFARMQMDNVSLAVRELLPKLLTAKPRSEEAAQALKMLATWDGAMAAGRPEPLIVVAWWRELARALYADELGSAFRANWRARPIFMERVLSGKSDAWCDNVRTPRPESCEEVLSESLEKALTGLRKRYGVKMQEWKWGDAHLAQHRHRPFSRRPWLARFFDIDVPSAGDAYTVNAGRGDFSDEASPYANRHAPSYRAIYDLANPEASLFIHSTGQSGNPLSPHYRSFADAWARGEYIRMVTDRERLEAEGAVRLVLIPQK